MSETRNLLEETKSQVYEWSNHHKIDSSNFEFSLVDGVVHVNFHDEKVQTLWALTSHPDVDWSM